jgi:hypothetical protein
MKIHSVCFSHVYTHSFAHISSSFSGHTFLRTRVIPAEHVNFVDVPQLVMESACLTHKVGKNQQFSVSREAMQ